MWGDPKYKCSFPILNRIENRRPTIINFGYVWLTTQLCLCIRLLYIDIYGFGQVNQSKCTCDENCCRRLLRSRWILVGVLQRSFGGKSLPKKISSHLLRLLFCVMCVGNCSWLGTLSIDNDASQPRQTGSRVSFSAGKTKFKQCSFPDRRRLFPCKELCLVTDLLWHSKTSVICISFDDGLIDDGKFIALYDLHYSFLEVFSSSRSFCFCFEVKSEYRSRTALDLQLL